jgi:uncharacterized protein (TIGR03437 family)
VNPAGLLAGRYSGSILITSAGAANNPVLLPVELIVSGLPLLTTSSFSLQFPIASGSAPSSQTLHIGASGGSLSVSASSSPATPWLSISASGNTPFDLIVTVNPAGLAPGTYQGFIQVIGQGAGNSPLTIPVTVQVAATPILQTSKSQISFTAENGQPPLPQTIGVTLGGQPATGARAAVAPGAGWLSAQAAGGQITITVNPAGLLAGTYTGSVLITAEGAANSPLTVPVTFTVPGIPEFDISQSALAFVASRTNSQPQSTMVTLGSGGGTPVNFDLNVTASTWLSVTPLTGSTPANLTITVDPKDLRPGSYTGSVIVNSSGHKVRTIVVNLVVADAPVVSSSPPFLEFNYLNGSDMPGPVNVWVGRFGANVSVTATTTEPWVTVDPASPTTSGPVKVTVVPTGLPAGIHRASLVLTATGTTVAGTPVTAEKRVPVTLYVDQPASPRITRIVNGMSFLETPLAPGLIFTIFGTGLGPDTPAGPQLQPDGTLSPLIGGVEVLVNGIPCPLLFVSSTQINAVAPYALFNRSSAAILVRFHGVDSIEVPINVAPSLPGLFSYPPSGAGPGAILNQDQSVNTSTNPAARESIISLFGGGGGQTSPQGVDGSINPVPPSPNLLTPLSVTIGGILVTDISYAGAAPGLPDGTLQINVRVPDSVPSGNIPVLIKIGDAISQGGLTLSVR